MSVEAGTTSPTVRRLGAVRQRVAGFFMHGGAFRGYGPIPPTSVIMPAESCCPAKSYWTVHRLYRLDRNRHDDRPNPCIREGRRVGHLRPSSRRLGFSIRACAERSLKISCKASPLWQHKIGHQNNVRNEHGRTL